MSFHNSKKVTINGILFDSKLEGEYYIYLKGLKTVKDIIIQPVFTLFDKNKELGLRSITYIGDFLVVYKDGHTELIDVKGMATETSKLKRKIYMMVHNDNPPLKWICKYKGEWVDYFDNQKRIRDNKKLK